MGYYLPPEWHRQAAVQLTWPHKDTDWAGCLAEIGEAMARMAAFIARSSKVVIAAREPAEVWPALEKTLPAGLAARVVVAECDTDDTWARDHAPLTLLSDNGGAPLLLDFKFNGWGGKFPSAKDNLVGRRLFEGGVLGGCTMEDNGDFVLEGGSIESDGCGTVFTTANCLLAPNRNQPMGRDGIEKELLRRLRAGRVVWIENGLLDGDDTDGHIDTLVRTAPGNTLLYMAPLGDGGGQDRSLAAMEEELHSLRTVGGERYRLVPLPSPDPVVWRGERLPATYANFLVLNGAVMVPSYGQPQKDRLALEAVASAFPGREVGSIDATVAVRQHGSLHCLSMQYPEGVEINKV